MEGLGYYRSTVGKAAARLERLTLAVDRSVMPVRCCQTAVYPEATICEKSHPALSSHCLDLPTAISIEGRLTTSKKIRPLRKLR